MNHIPPERQTNILRMPRLNAVVGIVAASLLLSINSRATQDPVPPPPQVETLKSSKQATAVHLTWTDGTGPYVGVRSQTPNFLNSHTIFYVSRGIAASPLDDATALSDSNTYFYLLNDVFTYPEVYTDTALIDYVIGDTVTLDGANFSPGSTHVYVEGIEVPTTSVSSSQIQFNIPASTPSGNIIVSCASGLTTERKFNVFYFKTHADLTHVNVDANHDAWVVERGSAPTSDKAYKINHTTGVVLPFTSINESEGLPIDSGGNQYVCNSLVNALNTGIVRIMDPAGVQASWGTACTGGTPCYCRGLAIDPNLNAPAGLTVYFLDGNSGFIKAVTTASRSNYQNVGAGIPDPGGLAINALGRMFYTQNNTTIQEIDAAKNPIFTYTGAPFNLMSPAQIHVENNRRIWVANRVGNNILRISTDPSEPPGPASRKVIAKYSNLTSPRGIAVDHDPAIDPVTGLSYTWAYVAEQTKFSRFRVYDTVWVNINVLNEAMNSPTADVAEINANDMTARVMKDFNKAREIYKQAGIDLRLRALNFIADPITTHNPATPGAASPRKGWVAVNGAILTSEQNTLFANSRSANVRDINVYYVLSMWDIGASAMWQKNGVTYTNDYIPTMDNSTQSAIIISRYSLFNGVSTYTLRQNITTTAHEIGHFLMDYPGAGIGEEHNVPNKTYLMWSTGDDAYTLKPSHITNIQGNSDESVFIDRF